MSSQVFSTVIREDPAKGFCCENVGGDRVRLPTKIHVIQGLLCNCLGLFVDGNMANVIQVAPVFNLSFKIVRIEIANITLM